MTQALRELCRQAERVVDAQVDAAGEGDQKSRHWMATTVAAFGAAAAVAALAGRVLHGPVVWPAVALLVASVCLGGRAFMLFSHAYSGGKEDEAMLAIGWDAAHLTQALDKAPDLAEVLMATVTAAEGWIQANADAQSKAARLRRQGRTWLFASGATLATAFIYSLGVNGF